MSARYGEFTGLSSLVGLVRGPVAVLAHPAGPPDYVRQVEGVDFSSPFVDAVLPDGSRLHVVIPDITAEHWAVNIRKFVVRANHLDELVVLGTLSALAASFLDACVVAGLNVLVAGGTQAGKTTMLNCLTAAVPARERVITCEEVFELLGAPLYAWPPEGRRHRFDLACIHVIGVVRRQRHPAAYSLGAAGSEGTRGRTLYGVR